MLSRAYAVALAKILRDSPGNGRYRACRRRHQPVVCEFKEAFRGATSCSILRRTAVGNVEVVARLQIDPKFRRHAEVAPEAGFGSHALKGDRRGQYAVTITRNWRITFRWLGEDAIDVGFEDYHGG